LLDEVAAETSDDAAAAY
jgi:hypothetical protein